MPRLPRDGLPEFQAGLDHWRRCVYNPLRPHEALGDRPPLSRWRPSPRPRPAVLPAVEYPPGAVLRKVAGNGGIRWRKALILAGNGLVGDFDTIFSGFLAATSDLTEADRAKLFHDNAVRIYRL